MADLASLLRSVPEEELREWVTAQRWFASKAREMSHFEVLDVDVLGEGLAYALIEARFHAGTHDLYQVLVGTSGTDAIAQVEGTELRDALTDPEQAVVLARLMEEGREIDELRFHWTGAFPKLGADPQARPVGVEQSNTSIIFDDSLVLKVFRRVQPGDNPELEMLKFLGTHGFEDHIAALAGWYDFRGDRMEATLGVLQRYVAGAQEGWEAALEALHTEPGFLAELRTLGQVTGRMHTVLASDGLDPDFSPEEPSDEALGLLTAMIDEEIERTFVDLPADDERVAAVAGRGEEIRDRLQMLSHASVGGRVIRHHGDYHLGQCLLAPDGGWVILDFEGEPARSIAERRRQRSPLRDVAGMLRSVAYAASATELMHGRPAPEGWEDRARAAFLEGYLESVDPALLPAGEAAIHKLLAIFELEKAIYELRYDLQNRPDWVKIPVAGIARLLDAPLG